MQRTAYAVLDRPVEELLEHVRPGGAIRFAGGLIHGRSFLAADGDDPVAAVLEFGPVMRLMVSGLPLEVPGQDVPIEHLPQSLRYRTEIEPFETYIWMEAERGIDLRDYSDIPGYLAQASNRHQGIVQLGGRTTAPIVAGVNELLTLQGWGRLHVGVFDSCGAARHRDAMVPALA